MSVDLHLASFFARFPHNDMDSEWDQCIDLPVAQFPPVNNALQTHPGSPGVLKDVVFRTSKTFYLGAYLDYNKEDIIIVSSDGVLFYTHACRLLAASSNGFNNMLSLIPPKVLAVTEQSSVLNLILHVIFNLACAQPSPSFAESQGAVEALGKYGISAHMALTSRTPLSQLLLAHAPLYPLDVYTIAASHDAAELAIAASSHLLSFPLYTLTDETSQRIGSVYLKKLLFLHLGRVVALKRLLAIPPSAHTPTETCGYLEQEAMARIWALTVAHLSWEARPDTTTKTLSSAFTSAMEGSSCSSCRVALGERVRALSAQWSLVKSTI